MAAEFLASSPSPLPRLVRGPIECGRDHSGRQCGCGSTRTFPLCGQTPALAAAKVEPEEEQPVIPHSGMSSCPGVTEERVHIQPDGRMVQYSALERDLAIQTIAAGDFFVESGALIQVLWVFPGRAHQGKIRFSQRLARQPACMEAVLAAGGVARLAGAKAPRRAMRRAFRWAGAGR